MCCGGGVPWVHSWSLASVVAGVVDRFLENASHKITIMVRALTRDIIEPIEEMVFQIA